MPTLRAAAIALAGALALTACGQRGPLYLPEQAPKKRTAPASTDPSRPAPAPGGDSGRAR